MYQDINFVIETSRIYNIHRVDAILDSEKQDFDRSGMTCKKCQFLFIVLIQYYHISYS